MEAPMRPNRFSTILVCAVCLFIEVFSRAQTVTQLQTTDKGFPVVQVSINGSGPYSFFLDTGSNRTLVRKEILEDLSIASGRPVPVHTATGVSYVQQTVVSSVAVAGVAVHELEIEGIDAGQLSRLGGSFQGVLGEDFLKHFDVLIDNHAKTLTLDETSELAHSLAGDHLPLSFSGTRGGHPTTGRLVFDLKLLSSGDTTHFLIDSGANYIMFFPPKPLPFQRRTTRAGTLQTFGGSGRCHIDVVPLEIGKDTLPAVELAFCEGMRGNTDVDGVLPTNTFKRLFISHSGAYAIANPRLRKSSPGSLSRSSSGN
jgi:hypothetical protein